MNRVYPRIVRNHKKIYPTSKKKILLKLLDNSQIVPACKYIILINFRLKDLLLTNDKENPS